MKQYKSLLILGITLLVIGAASPVSPDKEAITRLQGEVMVLQRQMRDLQESIDKWQGQNSSALQQISENLNVSTRKTTGIEESIRGYESTRKNSYAGTNTQIQKLLDYQIQSDQKLTTVTRKIVDLESIFLDHQKKIEEMLRAATPSNGNANNLETASQPQTLQAAYLNLSLNLLKSERRSEGISMLKKLIAEFPNTTEASQAKDELARLGEK